MTKAYIYIVSDGLGDIFKFGFTTDPLARITKYNTTESFRPVLYNSVVEYSTEREARDLEIELKKELKNFIKNPKSKPEVSQDNVLSRNIYENVIENSNFINKNLENIYNSAFIKATDKLDYESVVDSIVSKAKGKGLDEKVIYDSIIKNSVGYHYENASPIVIKENRRKKLITINNLNLYYDTKPKIINRIFRLAQLDNELKTGTLLD